MQLNTKHIFNVDSNISQSLTPLNREYVSLNLAELREPFMQVGSSTNILSFIDSVKFRIRGGSNLTKQIFKTNIMY